MKLSDLRSAAEIHEQDMRDPEYEREYERTRLASDVAERVLAYRAEHRMSQTELARRLGTRQPNIARLESGEHEPTVSTLRRLSWVIGLDFSVEAGEVKFRQPRRTRKSTDAVRVTKRGDVAASKIPAKVRQPKVPGRRSGYVLAAKAAKPQPRDAGQEPGTGRRSAKSLPAPRSDPRRARRWRCPARTPRASGDSSTVTAPKVFSVGRAAVYLAPSAGPAGRKRGGKLLTGGMQRVGVIRRHWLIGELARAGRTLGQDRGGPAGDRKSPRELLPVGLFLAARR